MSHFSVAVLTKDGTDESIDKIMLPYHEFECTGIEAYIQEIDETDESIEEYLTKTKEKIKLSDGKILNLDDALFSRPATQDEIAKIKAANENRKDLDFNFETEYTGNTPSYEIKNDYPADAVKIKIKYCDEMRFPEFINYWNELAVIKFGEVVDISDKCKYGYFKELMPDNMPVITLNDTSKEAGNMLLDILDVKGSSMAYGNTEDEIRGYLKEHYQVISRTNPNREWDWYDIGGRWKGMLNLKSGGTSNNAKLSDIDFSMDKDTYAKSIRFWEVVVEDSPLKDGEKKDDFWNFYKKGYYTERYGSKEDYAKEQAEFGTFALVDLDGKWHEKGDMGWFGISDDTKGSSKTFMDLLNQKIADADPDTYLTIVDCHI